MGTLRRRRDYRFVERPGMASVGVTTFLPHESSMGVAGMPLPPAVSRPPRVASVLTRTKVLALQEETKALTHEVVTVARANARRV
jgi:hypothetical protein